MIHSIFNIRDPFNIRDFGSILLKIDKKSYKNIDIYNIRYITIKNDDYKNINNVNPLYLLIDKVDGYIEENNLVLLLQMVTKKY